MDVIASCSFKGGTAKTSTVLHIATLLAQQHGKRVLLIDFDAQANLTTGLGFSNDQHLTMVKVLQGEAGTLDVVQRTPIAGLDLIAANVYLDGVEATSPIVNDLYGHERLRRSLKGIDYYVVFIDTPPSLGWLTQSAFFAAQYSIICAGPEQYSLLALTRLKEYPEQIQEHHDLSILGVVLSFWDERGATNPAYVAAIEEAFPGKLFPTKIRRDISVSRSVLKGLPVTAAYPHSRAASDYASLTGEFLARISSESLCQVQPL